MSTKQVMKTWFLMFFKNRWGRGQPDDIGAMNLGDDKYDPDSDKKPRAGQILWIRGLTRLQTQVTIPYLILTSFTLKFFIARTLFLYSLAQVTFFVFLDVGSLKVDTFLFFWTSVHSHLEVIF